MKFLSLILCITILLTCCNSTKNSKQKDTNYTLQGEYDIISINSTPLSNKQLTINFNDSQKTVSGYSGCNTFTGNYTINENTLHFSKIAYTKKFCPEAIKIEEKVIKTFSFIETVNYKNKQVLLQGKGDNALMTLEKK